MQKRVRMFSNWKESDGERYSGGSVDEFVCVSEKKNVHLSGCICACLWMIEFVNESVNGMLCVRERESRDGERGTDSVKGTYIEITK